MILLYIYYILLYLLIISYSFDQRSGHMTCGIGISKRPILFRKRRFHDSQRIRQHNGTCRYYSLKFSFVELSLFN